MEKNGITQIRKKFAKLLFQEYKEEIIFYHIIQIKLYEDIKYISGLGIDTDTNLQYAVGHFTILNPRIENGIFKGELFDIYDFDWINLNDLDSIKGVIINNIAFLLQIIRLKNYYFLIPIEFIW